MKKTLLIIFAGLLATSLSLSAQGRWFLDMGMGINDVISKGQFTGNSVGAQGALGFNFNEGLGVRLTAQLGIGGPSNDGYQWFVNGRYIRAAAAADVLWDIIGTFDETPGIFRVKPYARLQETAGTKRGDSAMSFGVGGGLRLSVAIVDFAHVILDANSVYTPGTAWHNGSTPLFFNQVTLGFGFILK